MESVSRAQWFGCCGERLEGSGGYSASPIVANGHLFAVSNRGVLSVVKLGDAFEQVHDFDLDEAISATPAVDETTLFVRSQKHLWAFR